MNRKQLGIIILFGALFWSGAALPQNQRPTALARQLEKEQEKLQQQLTRDVSDGKAHTDDWAERRRPLVRQAAERSAAYRLEDWKGEELQTLGIIFFFAEEYERSIAAGRAFLQQNPSSEDGLGARLQIAQSLFELKRFDEASRELAEAKPARIGRFPLAAERLALHRALAVAFRDRRRTDAAIRQAVAGLEMIMSEVIGRFLPPEVRDARDFEGARLAAMAIVLLERTGRGKDAEPLKRWWTRIRDQRQLQSEAIYEEEVAINRLIGSEPPAIAARRWLGGEVVNAASLQGKVTLIGFWAMWNADSVKELERWRALGEKYAGRGLQIVGVTRLFGRSDREEGLSSAREAESLEGFLRAKRITFPVAVGGLDDIANDERFGVVAFPTQMLLDRTGSVRTVQRGRLTERELEEWIGRLLGEG